MCDRTLNRLDEAMASLIGRDCGNAEHFCKGAELVLELTKTVQMMQLQLDEQRKEIAGIRDAECRDHKQIEKCRKALFLSAKKEFENGIKS